MMLNKRIFWIVAIAAVFTLLAVVYYFIDPVEVRWMPKCLWKMATGTDCPGCGSQRMAHALMHADLHAAWTANAYALCMLPVLAFLLWLEFCRESYPRIYVVIHSPVVIWSLAGSVLVWWVVRNLI